MRLLVLTQVMFLGPLNIHGMALRADVYHMWCYELSMVLTQVCRVLRCCFPSAPLFLSVTPQTKVETIPTTAHETMHLTRQRTVSITNIPRVP
jgi:hypothetical protein